MNAILLALVLLAAEPCGTSPLCNCTTGAPPIRTVQPETKKVSCNGGRLLSFEQNGVERYACLNLPAEARAPEGRKWPLIIYLHASETTPESLYKSGKGLYDVHDTYALSDREDVRGFILLAPEARRAKAWPGTKGATQTGFRWDEWYRDPEKNLDAAMIDHFLDAAIETGLVDRNRIYVFGWSNGGFTAALYGIWRGERIAAIGQYAGASPFARPPCPVPMPSGKQVPLILIRNLCDGVVPCSETNDWISDLKTANWPFESYNLSDNGAEAPASAGCATVCSKKQGVKDHIRWPQQSVLLDRLLPFFKRHAKE
ncbi:MAG TPA: prolyl oligopeptidase family serine peptidase [Thermoanaerobaculia bacterium]|nr:prolyl oligopeptidase family serine peptidase [Thermoanaerobaculia bacterium]